MNKLIYLVGMYLSCFGMLKATQTDSIPIKHHVIGISGSSITGFGVMYRYTFDNQFYMKAIASGYYTENNHKSSTLTSFLGLETQLNFVKAPDVRFYGFLGASYWYDKSGYDDQDNGIITYHTRIYETSNYGGGFGIEAIVWEFLAVNVDFGFQYSGVTYTSSLINDSGYKNSSRTGMGGGIGFGYQF